MSWIDDAKKEAIRLAKKESLNKDQDFIEQQAKRKRDDELWGERLAVFKSLIENTGIKAVLMEAQKQGLWVNVEREGYVANGPGSLFHFIEKSEYPTSQKYPVSYSYCIFWKVYEPSTQSIMIVKLGFEPIYGTKIVHDGLLNTDVIDHKAIVGHSPTTNAQKVESEIKAWLLEIFKKHT